MKDPCYSVPFRCYHILFDVRCCDNFVKCIKKSSHCTCYNQYLYVSLYLCNELDSFTKSRY